MTREKGQEILQELAAPFYDDEIEWKAQSFSQDGKKVLVVPYVDARAVMDRLDAVIGTDWEDVYKDITIKGQEGFQCTLRLKIGEEWRARTDGAEATEIEGFKGAYSGAFKRAASKWKIGRYLYDLPQYWLPIQQTGQVRVYEKKRNISGYVNPPLLNPRNAQGNKQQPTKQPSSQRRNQQSQQQPSNMKSQQPQGQLQQQPQPQGQPPIQQNRGNVQPLLNVLNPMISELGIPNKYVDGILKRIGSENTYHAATESELKVLYSVLMPVHSFLGVCRQYNLPMEQVIYYGQLTTNEKISEIGSLFFRMNKDVSMRAIGLIRADFAQPQQQQLQQV